MDSTASGKIMRRIAAPLITSLLMLIGQGAWAYDFRIDGIYYNKLSATTCAVTYGPGYYDAAFNGSYTGDVVIPTSVSYQDVTYTVVEIGFDAFFRSSSLTSVRIPASVTSIGNYVFDTCTSLTAIDVDEGNATYSSRDGVLFRKNGTINALMRFPISSPLTSYAVPDGINVIDSHAFYECRSLLDVTLPEGIFAFGNYAFAWCTSLKSITLPSTLTTVMEYAFYTDNLEKITCLAATPPQLGNNAFDFIQGLQGVTLYVPKTALADYKASDWSIFPNILGIEHNAQTSSVYSIGEKIDQYWYNLDGSSPGTGVIVFNTPNPRGNQSTIPWTNNISNTFVRGMSCKETDAAKFYFTPEPYNIKAQDGKTYVVTPCVNADNSRIFTTDASQGFEWKSEVNANSIIAANAIAYDKGAYANNKLYACYNNTYQEIATLDQSTGEVSLIPCEATFAVLNAVGFAEHHANIATGLRARVGVIAVDKARGQNVVAQMSDATFTVAWLRPLNFDDNTTKVVVDARYSRSAIYFTDIVRLFDWRGNELASAPTDAERRRGMMDGTAEKWLWAYYGVKSITIDCSPSAVMTDFTSKNFIPLSQVPPYYLKVTTGEDNVADKETYTFSLDEYNNPNMSDALYNKFNTDAAFRKKFGYIVVDFSNSVTVQGDFYLKIPITIGYDWGELHATVVLKVIASIGDEDDDKYYKRLGDTELYHRNLGNAIDIVGKDDNGWISSTTKDKGIKTAFKVGNNAAVDVSTKYGTTSNGVTVNVTVEPYHGMAKLCYTVKNNGTSAQEVSLGSYADIKVGNNDYAAVRRLERYDKETYGLSMTDTNTDNKLVVFLRRYIEGMWGSEVSDYWFGQWNSNNSTEAIAGAYTMGENWMREGGGYDSGMGWCWKKSIEAGMTYTFCILISIGDVSNTMDKFNVDKIDVTFISEVFAYDGMPHGADQIKTSAGVGKCSVSYYSAELGKMLTTAPVLPGTYDVDLHFDEGEYFKAADFKSFGTITIKAPWFNYTNLSQEDLQEKLNALLQMMLIKYKMAGESINDISFTLNEASPNDKEQDSKWQVWGHVEDDGAIVFNNDGDIAPITCLCKYIYVHININGEERDIIPVTLNCATGDSNFDSFVNVLDLQSTVNYIFGDYPTNKTFNIGAADINADNAVNVLDVVNLANLLLSKPKPDASSTAKKAPAHASNGDARLYVSNGKLMLHTTAPVAAADIALSENAEWNDRLGMAVATSDNRHAVLYSLNGTTLPVGETVIATLADGDATVCSAMLANSAALPISVSLNLQPTSIAAPTTGNGNNTIYDLSGRRVVSPAKGIYIINGKKISK